MENSNSKKDTEISGKKIFFLYPSAVIQNEIAFDLTQQEYEVYFTREHINLRSVLKQFPDSVVFINLDDGLSGKDWDNWIRSIQADPTMASVALGVITAVKNDDSSQKYSAMGLKGGYTVINKMDISKTIIGLMEILKANDAHGRRKFLRATTTGHEELTSINIPHNGQYYKGVINDISVAGLSCVFVPDPDLEKNSLCKDIQIKLHSTILKGEGIVFGSRMEGMMKVYVFIFTQRIDPEVRTKIRSFIQSIMQAKMDNLLK
ncbi:MAG: PilZ domain-containing protein [Treponema sp.]|jgi:hypothetical protein|nr:PilZ domain-containing protein [Treponema sp.]